MKNQEKTLVYESFALDGAPVMHALPHITKVYRSAQSGGFVKHGVTLSKSIVCRHFAAKTTRAQCASTLVKSK